MDLSDERYDRLGRELADVLGRSDGVHVAKSLHAHFDDDGRSGSTNDSGRTSVAFLKTNGRSTRRRARNSSADRRCLSSSRFGAAAVAHERAYVPQDKVEWYTDWLLRLNAGERSAKQAKERWLPLYTATNRDGQLHLFCAALGGLLPKIPGQLLLLELYVPTLDLRVQGTTAIAFGDDSIGQKLHAEAISVDENVRRALQDYSSGGGECYMLECSEGLLKLQLPEYGSVFAIWSMAAYAKEINEGRYGGRHEISPIHYRELEGALRRMPSLGSHYVAVDQRMNGQMRIVPVVELLQHVRQVIDAVESSKLGEAIRRGMES